MIPVTCFSCGSPTPDGPIVCGCGRVYGAGHEDDTAVVAFAAAMREKLERKRAQGRDGWNDPVRCSVDDLKRMLLEHVAKGDPVDIANLAMMLWHRGQRGNG